VAHAQARERRGHGGEVHHVLCVRLGLCRVTKLFDDGGQCQGHVVEQLDAVWVICQWCWLSALGLPWSAEDVGAGAVQVAIAECADLKDVARPQLCVGGGGIGSAGFGGGSLRVIVEWW
jgi:hypothetical protein